MKISIIAIFFNSEKYIRKCLDSILGQEEVNLEIIAVDDCSSDSTPEILKEYENLHSNIIVVNHEKNKGIAEARNSGLSRVSGDCFFLIDGDDCLADSKSLKKLADKFRSDVDWVQGSYTKLDESGNKIGEIQFQDLQCESENEISSHFNDLNFYYTHNKLINSKYKNHKFIPGCYHEDRLWIASIFDKVNNIKSVEYYTYNYLVRSGQTSNKARATSLYIDSGLMLMRMMAELPECWSVVRDTFQIVDIEKPLYLWEKNSVRRKTVMAELARLNKTAIATNGYPRFTKLVHKMVENGIPDWLINLVSKGYFQVMNALNHPI